MKAKLLRKIKKRFIIKYSPDKYSAVTIHDLKKEQILSFTTIRNAMDWITYRLGMFYQYQSWRSNRDYIKALKQFNAKK